MGDKGEEEGEWEEFEEEYLLLAEVDELDARLVQQQQHDSKRCVLLVSNRQTKTNNQQAIHTKSAKQPFCLLSQIKCCVVVDGRTGNAGSGHRAADSARRRRVL